MAPIEPVAGCAPHGGIHPVGACTTTVIPQSLPFVRDASGQFTVTIPPAPFQFSLPLVPEHRVARMRTEGERRALAAEDREELERQKREIEVRALEHAVLKLACALHDTFEPSLLGGPAAGVVVSPGVLRTLMDAVGEYREASGR